MKILADTNVLVSALATRGLCADLLQLIIAEHELLCAEVVLVELERILTKRLKVPQAAVERQLTNLRRHTTIARPSQASPYPVPDPDDDLVLASALQGHAEVLVSGDVDLLSVKEQVTELVITNPRGLWEMLRGSG